MFTELCGVTSLTELAILMPLVNTASAEENYLTDGLSKIEPGKLVRGLAGVRSIKLQETVFTTFCRRPAGPRLNHLCLSHNDLSQLSPQLFVEVCKLDISHNEASALEDL